MNDICELREFKQLQPSSHVNIHVELHYILRSLLRIDVSVLIKCQNIPASP